jgi:magnesium-transporting ATPase (P-type)
MHKRAHMQLHARTPATQTVQLSTFAVNYVGHPFNESLRENRGMRMSLTYAGGFLLLLVLEVVPQLNERWGRTRGDTMCVCVCVCVCLCVRVCM